MSERNSPEKVSLKYVKWVLQVFFFFLSFLVFPVHGAQSQTVNSLSSGITTKPTEARNSKEKKPGHKVILSWWGPSHQEAPHTLLRSWSQRKMKICIL